MLGLRGEQIINTPDRLRYFVDFVVPDIKKHNRKIVFTNGCFDILHRGHLHLLETAKSFGDILIVGLNSDTSIQIIKNKNRPICHEEIRAEVLAGVKYVDYVVLFSQPTPEFLISSIRPDILVKGYGYGPEGEPIIGSNIVLENSGCVISVGAKYFDSTTSIINRHIEKVTGGKYEE
jgi:D-beta-D-heptose 7-phosphate kinase/D-beta-D-heptose 1-phosphate adenosyltransferase